jgi:hypothetical protein
MTKVATKIFSSLDIYLSSFLALHGIEPALEVRNGKVVFVFDATDNLYRLMNRYNSNDSVPVADFVTSVKTLRGKMLTVREGIYGNGKGLRNGYSLQQT